jgi:CubicO group peptidase (beta-lactamase class C family)
MNDPQIRAHPIVSFGGIGSASALAKFYSMLASGGTVNGGMFFSQTTIDWMTNTLSEGIDRVFQILTAFSAGFMKDSQEAAAFQQPNSQARLEKYSPSSTRRLFGESQLAFGQPGAGGVHAFADPENKIAFAYVMNQMEQSVFPNEKSLRLVDAIYDLL